MRHPASVTAPLWKPDGSRITAIRFDTTTTYIYEHVEEDTPVEITEVVNGELADSQALDFRAITDKRTAALALDRRHQHAAVIDKPPAGQSVKIEIVAPPGMSIAIGISVTKEPVKVA